MKLREIIIAAEFKDGTIKCLHTLQAIDKENKAHYDQHEHKFHCMVDFLEFVTGRGSKPVLVAVADIPVLVNRTTGTYT